MNKKSKDPSVDLQINEYRLDTEWKKQAELYYQYAAELADARKELDSNKSKLEKTKASLYKMISAAPEVYGLKKSTENAINSAILEQLDYVDAQAAIIEAKYRVDILAALLTAFDHKKKALENLVQLFLANYFARPSTSEEGNEVIESRKPVGCRQRKV